MWKILPTLARQVPCFQEELRSLILFFITAHPFSSSHYLAERTSKEERICILIKHEEQL